MSHPLHAPSGRVYFHDGDYSGGFDFYLPTAHQGGGDEKFNIPSDDVLAMAAAIIRSRLVDLVENAADEDIVKFALRAPRG